MSTDPESLGFIAKLGGVLAAIAAPIVWIHTKLEKKADKEDVKKCLEHCEKLYQNAEKDRAVTRDLHDKAMGEIRQNQNVIIDILSRR